jgi:hypothetical protein
MARRTRFAWWAAIAALGALAVYAGTWRLWALTALVWSMYELCFCPARCGVATRADGPCRNDARGRLFACDIAGHQQLKSDALWRPTGGLSRLRVGVVAAHRKTPLPQSHVEPNERVMAYAAVLCVVAVLVQTAVGLTVL